MNNFILPDNEQQRLATLYSYELLDTLPEKDYDDITLLASQICNTPVSLITFLDADRQWFKSKFGTDVQQTAREYAFCSHTILQPYEMMVVADANKDERFANNPLVTGDPHVMFYAGVPLLSEDGYPLGSLCVLDSKPNELGNSQKAALKVLANQATRLIQLHRKTKELDQSRTLLQEVNKELEKFAHVIANDLKAPCDNVTELTDLIINKYSHHFDVDGQQLLSLLKYSAENIKQTIDNTLKQAETTHLLQQDKVLFTFSELMSEIKELIPATAAAVLHFTPDNINIYFFKRIIQKIIILLVKNAVTYNDKTDRHATVTFVQSSKEYHFTVSDNGQGIAVIVRNGSFEVFGENNKGLQKSGDYIVNLNEAKKLVQLLGGTMETSFEAGKGTSFTCIVHK